eukprot:6743555-Pyramimonas_sp.AAC.1
MQPSLRHRPLIKYPKLFAPRFCAGVGYVAREIIIAMGGPGLTAARDARRVPCVRRVPVLPHISHRRRQGRPW